MELAPTLLLERVALYTASQFQAKLHRVNLGSVVELASRLDSAAKDQLVELAVEVGRKGLAVA